MNASCGNFCRSSQMISRISWVFTVLKVPERRRDAQKQPTFQQNWSRFKS